MSSKDTFRLIPKEKEQHLLDEITAFFEQSRGEAIGMIAAQEVYDFVEDIFAPHAYNAGVDAAKKVFLERSSDMQLDFDLLHRNT